MTRSESSSSSSSSNKARSIEIVRVYDASVEDVWEMWTTKDGIESWWGPDGFAVRVISLDLRTGGVLEYTMGAKAPEMVAFMKNHGMPVERTHTIRFTEVTPPTRLVYAHLVDFVPDHAPYDVTHTVEIARDARGARLTLRFEAMHSDEWTGRAKQGWEQELEKLANALAR